MMRVAEEVKIEKKVQRKTKNLGFNNTETREESYARIEATRPKARCSDKKHEGERRLPIRSFYLGGKSLQGACISCQKNYRQLRSKLNRAKVDGKTKEERENMKIAEYGPTKECSSCKTEKLRSEFRDSLSMELGITNQCRECQSGQSSKAGIRDFIFLPDKDGIKYKKENKCCKCNGTNKLEVDHILPIAKGGSDCIENKQTLCTSCNSRKKDTIEGLMKLELLTGRYRDESLDFSDNQSLSRNLSKKVYDFRHKHINDSEENIKISIQTYAKKHNLGNNLERILEKIKDLKVKREREDGDDGDDDSSPPFKRQKLFTTPNEVIEIE